jgi:hypothetical protein
MASIDRAPAEIRWRIVPLDLPRALRPCAGCGGIRPFVSSGRFRVNAQKRRLDVWLIYRCSTCAHTWNREILARVAAERVDPVALSAFLRNDSDIARCHATDRLALARAGTRIEEVAGWRVERPDGAWPAPHEGGPDIRIELADAGAPRLDRLLATELGLSRTVLARSVEAGRLRIEPGGAPSLRRPVRDGTRIVG